MQPTVANLRPLFLLRGGEASVADFEAEAKRAIRLSALLKPGAYLLATAAVFDAALVVATSNAGTGGSNLLGAAIWAAVAMAILGAGQTAWLNASADDLKVPDANPDAEWRRAMTLLASGELQCWRSVEDELDERRLRRMNSTAFGRPFGILFLSPSAMRRWFGDRSLFISSRQSYFYDECEWRRVQQPEPSASLEVQPEGQGLTSPASVEHLPAETGASADWSVHPNFGDWASYLFMQPDRFRAIVDRAYPDGFKTACVCKPRLALMTAYRFLNRQGPGLAIDHLTSEARTAIWREGYVDNSLSNSARRGDIAEVGATTGKPADDWIASAFRGKYTAIASAIKIAESQLIVEGRLAPLD
jgi:hypothetical protein